MTGLDADAPAGDVALHPPWRHQAACRDMRPDVTPEQIREQTDVWYAAHAHAAAKEVCAGCPVTGLEGPCLQDALDVEAGKGVRSRWGIRGGLTASERWTMAQSVRGDAA